ncbi:hypothetical protein DdX_05710 [Ditylenchus destructor]|uniref:Membrane protein BRI3 n=1 Tax=Ditylenchus destructor TaxID=166010 RepID=A0AAD4R6V6_9BILA|nr:hypothetical protein DdX_05710 [Ditylenchus destructor]
MDKNNISPTAPPDSGAYSGLDNRPLEHMNLVQSPQSPPGYSSQQSAQDQNVPPPPSYQEAVNFPSMAPYQPNIFPKPPQPSSMMGAPQQQIYPPQPHYNSTGGQAAPTTYVIQTRNCAFCLGGTVENETDLCCLLCLIILAIFTFPFGLVLLCCIPCTTRKRCNRCRRLQA